MYTTVLALPRHISEITLDTDACDRQFGCKLMYDQPDGRKKALGYWSKSLTTAEDNFDRTCKEFLAVARSVFLLRPHLKGLQFTIRTDPDELGCIIILADAIGKLVRWLLRLFELQFHVVHRTGIEHQVAETLSRLTTIRTGNTLLEDKFPKNDRNNHLFEG